MKLQRMISVVLPALLVAGVASVWAAQLNVKPGLWEVTMPDNPQSQMQVCYTQEYLDSAALSPGLEMPGVQCQNEVIESTSQVVVVRSVCTGSMPIEGETRIEMVSPEAMSMHSKSLLDVGGDKQAVETTANYRWVAADCGNVEPFDPQNPLK